MNGRRGSGKLQPQYPESFNSFKEYKVMEPEAIALCVDIKVVVVVGG